MVAFGFQEIILKNTFSHSKFLISASQSLPDSDCFCLDILKFRKSQILSSYRKYRVNLWDYTMSEHYSDLPWLHGLS
jgi:hypothetical protein